MSLTAIVEKTPEEMFLDMARMVGTRVVRFDEGHETYDWKGTQQILDEVYGALPPSLQEKYQEQYSDLSGSIGVCAELEFPPH